MMTGIELRSPRLPSVGLAVIAAIALLFTACSNGSSSGSQGVTAVDSPATGDVVTGSATITWSGSSSSGRVEIRLSLDSGLTFPILIEASAPDLGEYVWNSATVQNGNQSRIQVAPRGTSGSAATSDGDFTISNAPVVTGFAEYRDEDRNSRLSAGDTLVIPLNTDVVVSGLVPGHLVLPVAQDSFGTGATVQQGAQANQLVVTFGSNGRLKSRQLFDSLNTASSAPSGVDLSNILPAGTIVSSVDDLDALASEPLDVVPGLRAGTATAVDWTAAVLGDFDRDGDLEIVGAGSPTSLLDNDGTGVFSLQQSMSSNLGASVAAGDLDGDGDLDLAVGEPRGIQIWAYTATGFRKGMFLGTTDRVNSIRVGDLDRDGDLDLVAGMSAQPPAVLRYENGGQGDFLLTRVDFVNTAVRLDLGDLNQDGFLDVVTVGGDVLENDRQGAFTQWRFSLGREFASNLDLGDVDRDGDLDIVFAFAQGDNRLFLNVGFRAFGDTLQSLGGMGGGQIHLFDWDGDADLDVASSSDEGIQIFRNRGDGLLTDTGLRCGSATSRELLSGDIDGDGDLDLLELASSGLELRSYHNSLSGTWGSVSFVLSSEDLGQGDCRDVEALDFNLDGWPDLVAGYYNQRSMVLLGDAGLGFVAGPSLAHSFSVSLAGGDTGGNGRPDILQGNEFQQNDMWINREQEGLLLQLIGNPLDRLAATALGDVDGDGTLDLIEGHDGQANKVWLNLGNGQFRDSEQRLGFAATRALTLGDLDGDGDLDLVAGNFAQGNVPWFNDGGGRFTASSQRLGSSATRAVILGDLDGDGDLDLAAGNDGGANRIWLNDGKGRFTVTGQSLAANDTTSLDLGDLDGDGDLDLVAGNRSQRSVVWFNDGQAAFSNGGFVFSSVVAQATKLIDFDRDGDLDLVLGNKGPDRNQLWVQR